MRIFPVAWFAACNPSVSWSIMKAIIRALVNITVWGGVSFSQKDIMAGISIITGMEIIDIRAVENLLSFSAKDIMPDRSPLPSAFMICGFIALSSEVDTNLMAPLT